MADTPVSPDEIKKIIEQASKEPGINDMLALVELSHEYNLISQMSVTWSEQPLIGQVSSTGDWLR
jgi:hypothetical protein